MNHHVIPTLLEDKPDIVFLYVGINGVLNRFDQDQIIKNIQEMHITCKKFNVSRVIISGIVFCKRADNSVINYINENLKIESTAEGQQFLDNGNIKLENLCSMGQTQVEMVKTYFQIVMLSFCIIFQILYNRIKQQFK